MRVLMVSGKKLGPFVVSMCMAASFFASVPNCLAQAAPVQGGISKLDLSLEHLRDLTLDLKQIMSATTHIIDEVTLTPENLSAEGNEIGFASVVPMRLGPRADGPPKPARRQRVDVAMANLTSVIGLLKQNTDQFVQSGAQLDASPDVQSKLSPLIEKWTATMGYLGQDFTALQKVTAAPDYANGAISDACTSLQGDVKDLEKVRSKITGILKDEEKRLGAKS
jgi:hypothetical protein